MNTKVLAAVAFSLVTIAAILLVVKLNGPSGPRPVEELPLSSRAPAMPPPPNAGHMPGMTSGGPGGGTQQAVPSAMAMPGGKGRR